MSRFEGLLFQDRIIMGAERKTHYIDPKDKKCTAYHEVSPGKSRFGYVSRLLTAFLRVVMP